MFRSSSFWEQDRGLRRRHANGQQNHTEPEDPFNASGVGIQEKMHQPDSETA
jgi:hypothetical protein